MTTVLPPTMTTATDRAATNARTWLRDRRDATPNGQWRNPDILARVLDVLDNITVTVEGPGRIVARTPRTLDGSIWHYLARDAVTAAAPTARIHDVTMVDAWTWALTWEV